MLAVTGAADVVVIDGVDGSVLKVAVVACAKAASVTIPAANKVSAVVVF